MSCGFSMCFVLALGLNSGECFLLFFVLWGLIFLLWYRVFFPDGYELWYVLVNFSYDYVYCVIHIFSVLCPLCFSWHLILPTPHFWCCVFPQFFLVIRGTFYYIFVGMWILGIPLMFVQRTVLLRTCPFWDLSLYNSHAAPVCVPRMNQVSSKPCIQNGTEKEHWSQAGGGVATWQLVSRIWSGCPVWVNVSGLRGLLFFFSCQMFGL